MKQSEKINSKNEESATNTFIVLIFRQLLNLQENTSSVEIVKKALILSDLWLGMFTLLKQNFDSLGDPFMELAQYISDTDNIL